jgi:hypothetical protein
VVLRKAPAWELSRRPAMGRLGPRVRDGEQSVERVR